MKGKIGFSYEDVQELLTEHYQLTGTLKSLPGELDLNYYFQSTDGGQYIVKLAHTGELQQSLDMQNAIMVHLANQPMNFQLPKVVKCVSGASLVTIQDNNNDPRFLRVLTWVPGNMLAHTRPHSDELLNSIGRLGGAVTTALLDFSHEGTRRYLKWDLAQVGWIEAHQSILIHPKLVVPFLAQFKNKIQPIVSSLRQSVIQNDANDYNLVVDPIRQQAIGLIDFGDAVHTMLIADLAIMLAYVIMDKNDPLQAAAEVVGGYHQTCPLQPLELEILYDLTALRLCTTVTAAALNKLAEPDNEYHVISEKPAWKALEKWVAIPSALAHYTFRAACGLAPCPKQPLFDQWLNEERQNLSPIFSSGFNETEFRLLDLSVASLDLGNNVEFDTIELFNKKIASLLAEENTSWGLGGYGEVRPFYTTDAYEVSGNNGPKWRTVHLGIDAWTSAGTKIYAPLSGKIISAFDNAGERDYGPTIILEHTISDDFTFYTLYGHLSRHSIKGLTVGAIIEKGTVLAEIGVPPENGNWPPHLHFQVILNLLDNQHDFPGVAFPDETTVWKSICPDPQLFFTTKNTQPKKQENTSDILNKRQKHLGPNLSISYQQPLHMVRGYQQYLYDHTGRRYLDTCNNVPHVGHQHPRVVAAAKRQLSVLNTNTRYLHENIIHFATELTATFPAPLEVCFFVNSGSEANELALRMARAYTRQKDMLAIEVGYHGNTNAVVDVSSYKFDGKGGSGAPPNTHILPIPDSYRGTYRDPQTAGEQYAAFADEKIANLKNKGKNIAGLICESILSCGGQIVLPKGYLKSLFNKVRAEGGLCIMDEVQVGFGRTGSHFWAFEVQDVVPDIITLGKPIGNGHPLGAVITSKAIAEAFANGMEYFNTFGGNPVSCAIGREVLQIIKDEGLQENARQVGQYLRERLLDLQKTFGLIGDVRGPGFFQGFELVKDRETLEPAAEAASYLANRMRERGVLMSTDGPLHNVIKIKPPMCFTRENVDFLVNQMRVIFNEQFMQQWEKKS